MLIWIVFLLCLFGGLGGGGGQSPRSFHVARGYGLGVQHVGPLQKRGRPVAGRGIGSVGLPVAATGRGGAQGLRCGIGEHAIAPDVPVCSVQTGAIGGMAPTRGGVRAKCDDCVVQVGGSAKDATRAIACTGKYGGR